MRLQFSQLHDIGSEAISWFSHGAGYSHVDGITDDGRLLGARSDVRMGVPAGVQIRPNNYAPFSRTLIVTVHLTPAEETEIWQFLNAQIGKPYDKEAIVGFIAGRDWHNPAAWFCSELYAAALENVGFFPYRLTTPANRLVPDELLLAISVLEQI